jgi:DNA-binding transcriptional ArsR family regulator
LFLRGPIPLPWLARASVLPGKALAVALALYFLSGLRGNQLHDLRLSSATLKRLGVGDRSTKYRALRALERAGLVRVVRQRGKNPLVTILQDDAPADAGSLPV